MDCNFYFGVLSPSCQGDFAEQLHDVSDDLAHWMKERKLVPAHLVMVRVCLTDAANQMPLLRQHVLYTEYFAGCGFSFVEQPLLNGAKIALQVWALGCSGMHKTVADDCVTIEAGDDIMLFHSVRFSPEEARSMDVYQQAQEAFFRHIRLLEQRGMTLEANCHRTWIYVRDIDRNYADVVRARNDVFEQQGLTANGHFIASTGIGGCTDNRETMVAVDLLSVNAAAERGISYLKALDYLNPTAEYGVAFERGTALNVFGRRCRFISGTASIDRLGQCLYQGDVLAQADRLFLNISKLLESDGGCLEEMAYYIVYLRDISDYARIEFYMKKHFPGKPFVIVEARVCRPEWLIEVEGIAIN